MIFILINKQKKHIDFYNESQNCYCRRKKIILSLDRLSILCLKQIIRSEVILFYNQIFFSVVKSTFYSLKLLFNHKIIKNILRELWGMLYTTNISVHPSSK